jgi:hypothetical protein
MVICHIISCNKFYTDIFLLGTLIYKLDQDINKK